MIELLVILILFPCLFVGFEVTDMIAEQFGINYTMLFVTVCGYIITGFLTHLAYKMTMYSGYPLIVGLSIGGLSGMILYWLRKDKQ